MKKLLIALSALLVLAGCMPEKVIRSQTEIREFQTRSWQTTDTEMVMKAVINTLQDDGYVLKNAVTDMGFVIARKQIYDQESEIGSHVGHAIVYILSLGMNPHVFEQPVINSRVYEATANITLKGKETTVRVNFVEMFLYDNGSVQRGDQIDDAKFYQEFFAKVDKGVFVQKEGL